MKSMFDDEIEVKPVLNEDDTGIPYLAMGGVFTRDVFSLSKYVDVSNRLTLRKAIMDMFTLYPEVTDDMIQKLASNLNMEEPALENEIYAILSAFLNKGKFNENPNIPIDPEQLRMGIQVEMEHTDCPLIAERIAKSHLVELPTYYTHLKEMEDKYKK